MTRAERNEKLHQEAIARQVGRRYGKLTLIAYDKSVKENLYFRGCPRISGGFRNNFTGIGRSAGAAESL